MWGKIRGVGLAVSVPSRMWSRELTESSTNVLRLLLLVLGECVSDVEDALSMLGGSKAQCLERHGIAEWLSGEEDEKWDEEEDQDSTRDANYMLPGGGGGTRV